MTATKRRWLTDEERARIKRLRTGGYSIREIAERVGKSKSTVEKVCRRGFVRKVGANPPAPPCFGLYGATERVEELLRRYRRGRAVIHQWMLEKGIQRPQLRHRHAKREAPADFADTAKSLTLRQACQRWNASARIVTRWRRECGLPTPRADHYARKLGRPLPNRRRAGWADRYFGEGARA